MLVQGPMIYSSSVKFEEPLEGFLVSVPKSFSDPDFLHFFDVSMPVCRYLDVDRFLIPTTYRLLCHLWLCCSVCIFDLVCRTRRETIALACCKTAPSSWNAHPVPNHNTITNPNTAQYRIKALPDPNGHKLLSS